jgi:hypothetical protein
MIDGFLSCTDMSLKNTKIKNKSLMEIFANLRMLLSQSSMAGCGSNMW